MPSSMREKQRFVEEYLADCIRCADDHFTTFRYVTRGIKEYVIIGQRGSNKKISVCINDDDFMSIILNVVRKINYTA